MAKTNGERQRDFFARKRERGCARLQFWVSREGSRGYLMSRSVGSQDEVGKALEVLTETGLLKMIIDHPHIVDYLARCLDVDRAHGVRLGV